MFNKLQIAPTLNDRVHRVCSHLWHSLFFPFVLHLFVCFGSNRHTKARVSLLFPGVPGSPGLVASIFTHRATLLALYCLLKVYFNSVISRYCTFYLFYCVLFLIKSKFCPLFFFFLEETLKLLISTFLRHFSQKVTLKSHPHGAMPSCVSYRELWGLGTAVSCVRFWTDPASLLRKLRMFKSMQV